MKVITVNVKKAKMKSDDLKNRWEANSRNVPSMMQATPMAWVNWKVSAARESLILLYFISTHCLFQTQSILAVINGHLSAVEGASVSRRTSIHGISVCF